MKAFLFRVLHNVVAHPLLVFPWKWTTSFHDWTALWGFPPDAVCVLYVKHKVLAVARRNTLDQWGLPGGGVESGEDPEFAARRELYEETQVLPENLKEIYRGRTAEGHSVITYTTDRIHGIPRVGDAGPVSFVSWEALLAGPFGDYNSRVRDRWLKYSQTLQPC